MPEPTRIEHDHLGDMALPENALYGIQTARAMVNFPLARRTVHPELIHAYGWVKLACLSTAQALGAWKDRPTVFDALRRAAQELADGALDAHIPVDALQGGAGTSLNMNVNEVIANRALQLSGRAPGDSAHIHPIDDVNRFQSTNDTYPTALRLAAIRLLKRLEDSVVGLVEAFQEKERTFAHVVKVGRTEMQDAVLTTLGREMGAYAEAFSRDRWRIYKCEERLRVVNLGGTAIGTGLAAPRQYIFRVVDTLREFTGIGFARAENLVEATQNADVFVEVSGILKACAASLWKIAGDLRLMASGPEGGLGEITLPERQAGSSIMPGKVNPVIPEAVTQAAMQVIANDTAITLAAAQGSLELNPFLPLVADRLLDSLDLLTRASDILRRHCVEGIVADEARCRRHVLAGTASATAIMPVVGYDRAAALALRSRETGLPLRDVVIAEGAMTDADFDACITPEAVCRLGTPPLPKDGKNNSPQPIISK